MNIVLIVVNAVVVLAVGLVVGYLGNERFKGIERRLDRFEDGVDARFDRVDARFDRVEARFERMDDRFDRVDARFERVDARFERMEARIDGGTDAVRADVTRLALALIPPQAGQA
jgi:hypothetical protein